MNKQRGQGCLGVLLSCLIIVLTVGGVWYGASQEAASYGKFCDKNVTTWDALWLDLRKDECD